MNQEQSILKRSGNWVFDEEVSGVFDTHIRKSLPFYEEFQSLIGTISKGVLTNGSLVYDIGTATGEVILSIHKENQTKKITYVGIDNSASMLKKAEEKCKNIERVRFHNETAENFNYEPSDLIVAAFALQFIHSEKRVPLLQKIKASLKENACFILCEKIKFECQFTNSLIEKIHENWKLKFFTQEEVQAKKKSLINVMFPVSFEENMNSLKSVGFTCINPVFQWGNFVCILAK